MDFIDHRSTAKFIFKTSATDEKARIDDSGNILTGKTSSNFSTAGAEVRNVGNIWATRDGGTPLALNRLSSEGTIAQFYKDGSSLGVIASVSSDFVIYSTISGHTGLRFGDGWIGSTNNAGTLQNGTVSLGTTSYKFADLHLSGNANIGGNATITGDLTVNGTTTTLNTATLDVEDKNITLNYGAGDTSSTADGAGITIQDAVDASNNATILWDATNDEFDFSHAINVAGDITVSGTVDGRDVATDGLKLDGIEASADVTDTTNVTAAGALMDSEVTNLDQVKAFDSSDYATAAQGSTADSALQNLVEDTTPQLGGDLDLNGNDITGTGNLDVAGTITADNNLTIQNSSAYGSIELGGVSGGFIDIKRPFSDDYDLRLLAEGDGGVINVASGELTIQRAGSAKLATTSTGIAVTGNATFADNGKAIFGAGNDLQIYHDGSNSYIDDAGSGRLNIRASDLRIEKYTGETIAKFLADGAVELNYNDVKKLATTATGVDVTGTVTADGFQTDTANTSFNLLARNSTNTAVYAQNGGTGPVFEARSGSMSAGQGDVHLKVDNNGDISFYEDTGTTAKFFWDASTERLAIGSTSPAATLDVVRTGAGIQDTLQLRNAQALAAGVGSSLGFGDSTGARLAYIAGAATGANNDNGYLSFYTRASDSLTERLRIDSSGFAGLGTSSPAAKLDIVDTASDVQMRVYKNDGVKNTRITLTADDSGAKIHYRDADNAGALRFNNNLGEVMRITANTTRVGIGNSAPTTALDVTGTVTADGFQTDTGNTNTNLIARNSSNTAAYIQNGGTGDVLRVMSGSMLAGQGLLRLKVDNNGDISFYEDTGTTAKFFWDASAERLGIGTSSPAAALDISQANARGAYLRSSTTGSRLHFLDSTTAAVSTVGIGAEGNNLVLYGGGAEVVRVASSGNVGIGTSSPDGTLHVKDTIAQVYIQSNDGQSAQLIFGDASDASRGRISYDSSDNIIFENNNLDEAMRIDSSGNVGIGTSSPSTALHLSGLTGSPPKLTLEEGGAESRIYATKNSPTNSDLRFQTEISGTIADRMVINYSGNLGIGTSSPEFPITAYGSSNQVYIGSVTPSVKTVLASDETNLRAYIGTRTNHPISFVTDGDERMRITASGDVEVKGGNELKVYRGDNATYGSMKYLTGSGGLQFNDQNSDGISFVRGGSTESMRLDASGNLLVGKSSASSGVAGHKFSPTGAQESTVDGGLVAYFNRLSSDGEIVRFDKANAQVGSIGSLSGTHIVIDSGGNRSGLRFEDNGLLPRKNSAMADGTVTLGNASYKFSDLYLSGTAYVGTSIGIGTSSPASKLEVNGDGTTLRLDGTANTSRTILLRNVGGSAEGVLQTDGNMHLLQEDASKYMRFSTANTERTRIDASGNQLWGKTAANNTTQGIRFLGSSGFMSIVRSNATAIIVNRIDGDGTLMEFRTSGTTRGSISISGSTTSYNTTSDERLKDNIEDAEDAGAIVDAIQVRKFDWKADGSHQKYGMVAQELGTVAPEAVSVPDDAEEMQSVDYSKLVPMMLKEIQTLRARVAQLEGEN